MATREARRGSVLVVDDEEGMRTSLVAILEEDFEVVDAGGVREAIGLCETRSFDVLVTDFQMGDGTGDVLLKHVAERYPRTQRILLTGHSQYTVVRELQRSGNVLVLFKPVNPTDLIAWVKSSVALTKMHDRLGKSSETRQT